LPRRTRINAVGQLPGIRRVAVRHRRDGGIYCGVLPCLASVTYLVCRNVCLAVGVSCATYSTPFFPNHAVQKCCEMFPSK
jgi:hypothetical protein